MPRNLRNLRFTRVALVDKGANFDRETKDGAHILLWKRHTEKAGGPTLSQVHVDSPDCPCPNCDQRDDYEKSVITSSSRNALPDSAFAAVWTDAQGKKQRKLPYKHQDGSLDHNHWANAQARIEGSNIPDHVKAIARHKLEAARPKEKRMKLSDLLKRAVGFSAESDAATRKAEIDKFLKALDTPGSPEHEAAEAQHIGALAHLHPDHVAAMKAHVDHLGKMIKAFGDGPHPDGHPVHAMKAAHDAMCKAIAANEDRGQTLHPEPPDGDEPDAASVTKAVAKATTDLEKRLKDTEQLLKSERLIRKSAEMVTVLKSFKATSFNLDLAQENNDVMRFLKMQDADPDGYKRTIELLKAADEQLAKGALYKSFGSSQSGTGSAEAQLQAKAEALIQKDGKLTKEQAWDKVSMENPALVRQYRAEAQ
jgi:hypothetical protein